MKCLELKLPHCTGYRNFAARIIRDLAGVTSGSTRRAGFAFAHTAPYRKFGFTLAEVLVTMGIIGVVAALTLPTLMHNNQQKVFVTQLRKITAEISSSLEKYMSDQRVDYLNETHIASVDGLNDYVDKYLKTSRDCEGKYIPCFADEYCNLDGGCGHTHSDSKCARTFTLNSGAAICVDSYDLKETVDEDGNKFSSANEIGDGVVMVFEIDINGKQGPNIYGRDMFVVYIDANGNLFDKYCDKAKYDSDDGCLVPDSDYVTNGAFGQIVFDGWEMNY